MKGFFTLIGVLAILLLIAYVLADGDKENNERVTATTTEEETVVSTTTREDMTVEVALIALEGEGVTGGNTIGCGDKVAIINRSVRSTEAPLRAALEELLSLNSQDVEGYYNALSASDLEVDGVSVVNGNATIALTGDISLGGTCDTPRVEAQLEETALRFETVESVTITLNGEPLSDALSSQ